MDDESGSTALQPSELADVPALSTLIRANREFLAPTSPLRPDDHFTDAGQEHAARNLLEAARHGSCLPMLIVDPAGGIVGTLNINSIIRGVFQSASIGYWVARDRNGEGIASRAVAAALGVAFIELGLHRIQAETLLDNPASQRVLLKNGFVQYGAAADYLEIAGRWQPHALFQAIAPSS